MTQLTSDNIERFWSKVNKTESCWLWIASKRNGYGAFKVNGTVYDAHRISWQIAHGDMPTSKILVCHSCDVRLCVNPDHLFIGTHETNMQDASVKGRLISPQRNFSDDDIKEIRRLYAEGMMQIDIAAKFHVVKSRIWDILNNRTYRH